MADSTSPVPTPPAVPTDLAGLTAEEITDLHGKLEEAYQALRADATVDKPDVLEAMQQIRAEQTRLAAESTDRVAKQAQFDEALNALDADAVTLPEAGDPVEQAKHDAETPPAPAAQPDAERVPVAANAAPAPAVAATDVTGNRAEQAPTPAQPAVRQHLQAAASQQQFAPGAALSTSDLGRLFSDGLHRRVAGITGVHQEILASISGAESGQDFGGMETLDASNVRRNDELIAEQRAARLADREGHGDARTAAICGPLDILRDIPGGQDVDENLSGIFPTRPAGRLGYQYTPASSIATVAAGLQEWLTADQDAVDEADPSTWKPCVDVDCPTTVNVTMTELVACITVEESTSLSSPEKVDEVMRLVRAAIARQKVGRLLTYIHAASIRYTDAAGPYGAFVQAAGLVMRQLERARFDQRLSETGEPYTLVVGPGFGEALQYDRIARGFNMADCEPIAEVFNCLQRTTGASAIVNLADVITGGPHPFGGALPAAGGAAIAMPQMPTAFPLYLVPTESFLYSTTGEAETGWQTDPQLVRQNRKQWFWREWLSLARVGIAPSFSTVITLCANGARAGTVTPDDCTP